MVYRAIGVLDNNSEIIIAFAEFHENAGVWSCEIMANEKYQITPIGESINKFIKDKGLQYQVALISYHAYSSTRSESGAIIATETELPVITDLQTMDIALGGNGEFFSNAAGKINLKLDNDETPQSDLKKAVCIAFMGVLRWREEYNFLSSITGARRNSIGGAVWLGQEA